MAAALKTNVLVLAAFRELSSVSEPMQTKPGACAGTNWPSCRNSLRCHSHFRSRVLIVAHIGAPPVCSRLSQAASGTSSAA